MSSLQALSTAWKEQIAADEVARFAAYVEVFKGLQARKSAQYGNGRALHRKQLCAARGTLEVLGDLPEFARQGLFAFSVCSCLCVCGIFFRRDLQHQRKGVPSSFMASCVLSPWAFARGCWC